MKQKLSTVEHLIDANITCVVSVDGHFSIDRLRSALNRVQRKHPVLRMLISEEKGELYYEADAAKAIPLRMVEVTSDDDCTRECDTELATVFPHRQPQLRVVWLKSEHGNELLITTTHRICDGMSVLTLVREILKSLYSDDALVPYEPVTIRDVIGDLHDDDLPKRQRAARIMNTIVSLVPGSRRLVANNEIYREWIVSQPLSVALKQRCKLERVSIHTALLTVLDKALQSTLGKQAPSWIDNPFDGRRGRLSMIKSDMLFFSGGSFKIKTGQNPALDFWERARELHEEGRQKIDQELANIPGKYQYFEMLKVPADSKMRSIIRLQNFLSRHGNRSVFSFSNLGNIHVVDDDAPFQLKNLRLFVHSFGMRFLGIVAYSLHGQLRFVYMGDEKCLNHAEVDALQRQFMALLEKHVGQHAAVSEPTGVLSAVTE
ncbi:MAG: condensation domain-containing protein [Rhodanobacter sp.]